MSGSSNSGTEGRDPATSNLDLLPPRELTSLLLERQTAACLLAVEQAHEALTEAVEQAAVRLHVSGRLLYLGAGTSGRLLAADASELPPTFGWPKERLLVIMPGVLGVGSNEDDSDLASTTMHNVDVSAKDVIVAVAASGRTPFVLAGIDAARRVGALVIAITANPGSELAIRADLPIVADSGAEPIMGSTRMRAGLVQKLLITTFSTALMVRLGRTYGDLMVDMPVTLTKLADRAVRMVAAACDIDLDQARAALQDCDGDTKAAIVSVRLGIDADTARVRLREHRGVLRTAPEHGYVGDPPAGS